METPITINLLKGTKETKPDNFPIGFDKGFIINLNKQITGLKICLGEIRGRIECFPISKDNEIRKNIVGYSQYWFECTTLTEDIEFDVLFSNVPF